MVVLRPEPRPATCAVSPVDRDANIVVRGVGADSFCRAQARLLRLRGDSWTYRSGRELFAPDHGTEELTVVCRLARGRLELTVYDAGSRTIGEDVCRWYASGSWRESSIA